MLAVATPLFAQQPDTTLALTAEQIKKMTPGQFQVYQQMLETQQSSNSLTPEKVDRYAQMGKGLGIAINEGLGAVTKNVEQFSQTSAGKWLMVLITWKVMGEDAIGFARTVIQWIVGLSLLVVGVPFWVWLVKRNCVNRPIAKIEKTGFWTKNIIYTDKLPLHEEYIILYGFCFLIYLGGVAAITFLH